MNPKKPGMNPKEPAATAAAAIAAVHQGGKKCVFNESLKLKFNLS